MRTVFPEQYSLQRQYAPKLYQSLVIKDPNPMSVLASVVTHQIQSAQFTAVTLDTWNYYSIQSREVHGTTKPLNT